MQSVVLKDHIHVEEKKKKKIQNSWNVKLTRLFQIF